ncbi:MAG: DUF2634 domain-containing protein [Epulopiscium sp.]|nr:DUF2634 domain-containing protein [Candidatus Epulonipiscium sp.]
MIPNTEDYLIEDFEVEVQPSKVHKAILDDEIVMGFTDELDAVKQAIYFILNTERYNYVIYTASYGIELSDLYGEHSSYVCPELERRIKEALLQDDRILDVNSFEFEISNKDTVITNFVVETVFGNLEFEKVVNI